MVFHKLFEIFGEIRHGTAQQVNNKIMGDHYPVGMADNVVDEIVDGGGEAALHPGDLPGAATDYIAGGRAMSRVISNASTYKLR